MPFITINNKEIEFENGMTVMQACELSGIEIPRFCYHDKLSIAGNCRTCLVEMEKSPKPIASCAMPAAEGMKILTNTKNVENEISQVETRPLIPEWENQTDNPAFYQNLDIPTFLRKVGSNRPRQ